MNVTKRQSEIIALAAGPHAAPTDIAYTPEEHFVWQTVSTALEPIWEQRVESAVLAARDKLALPTDHIPQLREVSMALEGRSGFVFRAVGGLAPREAFFSGLKHREFLSTQFIRSAENPFYTKQPDVVHELIGHATLLADPALAELHELAGQALTRVETEEAKQAVANVWWFSGEFGVVRRSSAVKAVGAGILSSISELQNIGNVRIEPLDPTSMATQPYVIDQLQPILFGADSSDHLVHEVGTFFETITDGMFVCREKE